MKGTNKVNKDNEMNRRPYTRLLKCINNLFVVDIVLHKNDLLLSYIMTVLGI